MISPPKKKSKNKDKHKHHEKEKDKDKDKELDSKYKTNLYQNDTNYSIKLIIIEGKLQIFMKSTKSFSEDIYEFSNTYSFRQLQITNKYFSNFNNIDEVCTDLDKLLKLKVTVEEEKDKTLILKIPTSMDKSSGDIIFKLMKVKKVKKVRHSSRDKMKMSNIDIINKKLYETNIPGKDSTNLLLGNISELVDRVKKLEKKEIEKDKTISKLKEEMNNYQEKLNNTYNYPIYSPLAKKSDIKINLADDKNNNISQIIKIRNEDDDDDDIDINFENDTIKDKKNKKKKKNSNEIKNKSDSDNEDDSSDSDIKKKKKKKKKKSDSFLDESKKDISNGKEDSDEDKSNNILLKSGNKNFNINNINNINNNQPQNETTISGFPIKKRDVDLKDYINSRIFFTKREMQTIKKQITKGQRNLHAYFDLLYRASIDGPEESKIDSFCKGKYPQLILFFTQEGARFGVYVEKEKAKSIFKKEEIYKEIPGTSFLFSLNTLRTFPILPKELGTDNRPEKLCFGRTYYYNNNESNWLIYIPNNNFLNVDLKFGDKESSYQNATYSDIVGNSYNYHLKDVEIFQVMLEDDGTGININNNAKKKKKEKIEKIEEEKDEEEKIDMNKIYHDDTVISQIKENEEKNKDKVKIELSKVGVNEDEEENV
jgi:hypothetical protein